MMLKLPKLERSAGIPVRCTHWPLAKSKKLSPAATLRSMPETSKPKLPSCALATAAGAAVAAVVCPAGALSPPQPLSDSADPRASARIERCRAMLAPDSGMECAV